MKHWIKTLFTVSIGCTLAACGSDKVGVTGSSLTSAGKTSSGSAPVTSSTGNRAPTITGAPSTAAAAGVEYSFVPQAADADGNKLSFTITGKPSWATFSTATGALTGTAQAGTYAGITISVSDGESTQALPAFTLVVNNANFTGTASLAWSAPTESTDGSALSSNSLSGYRIYHGTVATSLNQVIDVTGSANTQYVVQQLPPGTHYFAVTAVSIDGVESAMSAVQSKAIL